MRLRYFHIRNYPPLEDVEIVFSAHSPLNTTNAIHFVVGINGSGKTHLLQALTETFLSLENKQSPSFPVTLIYELGKEKKHTYVFHHSNEEVGWWQSADKFVLPPEAATKHFQNIVDFVRQSPNSGWSALIREGNWPGISEKIGLPVSVLAYTTGHTEGWYELFKERKRVSTINFMDEPEERPAGWSLEQEKNAFPDKEIVLETQTPLLNQVEEVQFCQFVTPFMLKLAVLAVTLNLALEELKQHLTEAERTAFIKTIREKQQTTGLRGLLSQVGWVWPVSFVIECNGSSSYQNQNTNRHKFSAAYLKHATTILTEPEPSTTWRVVFDVWDIQDKHEFKELIQLSKSPFTIFQRLLEMHECGMMENITIGLRKADTEDILIFDELSDGEQMYLGRMALFHLLENQDDALLLLDEPETHFNDRWKRDLVDIIDQVIGKQANHVLISTHSGIALTDVFTDEITVIEKDEFGHPRHKSLAGIHTFGSTPDHPLRDIFGAPGTVGKRASALLDVLLLCEPNKEVVEKLWSLDKGEENSEIRAALTQQFIAAVQAEYKEKYSDKRIAEIIKTLGKVANDPNQGDIATVAAVAKYFADIVGPGYYQFDLYRSVFRLTKESK